MPAIAISEDLHAQPKKASGADEGQSEEWNSTVVNIRKDLRADAVRLHSHARPAIELD